MIGIAAYRIKNASALLTPALAIYPEIVDHNIDCTVRLLGNVSRWRPHLKTAKLGFIMRLLAGRGVVQAKCSTALELETACEAGMKDVLLAYPVVGANAVHVRGLAQRFRDVRISVLVENSAQAASWAGGGIGIFIDVNSGMDRTGIGQEGTEAILALASAIAAAGIEFRGLHYYDGHVASPNLADRESRAHLGYDRLMAIVASLESAGARVEEVITSGTPVFPFAASYAPFRSGRFIHRASPGTVIYGDTTSLTQLPAEWGYRPSAVVVSTVVSHPKENYVTCDAGHKSVSADAGVPTCAVMGRPDLRPLKPSEEHLTIEVQNGAERPQIGDTLYLIPRHVCPTVNLFDDALIVQNNRVSSVEQVTARGHNAPLLGATVPTSASRRLDN